MTITTRHIHISEPVTVVSGEIPPGHYVALSVGDTGKGIERSTLSRIFEPFFTTKERGSGTGLGLAAVYSTVDQAKGFLGVRSEAEKGTIFTIYLPAADAEPTAEQTVPGDPVEHASGGDGRVLIVVPDKDIRQMLARLLGGHGYTVYETSNPGEALIVVEELSESFDLTICDFSTPLISGVRLLERVERSAPGKPSILLLDPADHLASDALLSIPDCRTLRKPFGPQAMLDLVNSALLE